MVAAQQRSMIFSDLKEFISISAGGETSCREIPHSFEIILREPTRLAGSMVERSIVRSAICWQRSSVFVLPRLSSNIQDRVCSTNVAKFMIALNIEHQRSCSFIGVVHYGLPFPALHAGSGR